MTVSADLFDLIHSLDKAEKRYFKLHASIQKGGKNYERLFDDIVRQEEYDEEALKQKFKDETLAKQFHVAKNYLYNLILRAMRAYSEDHTVESRLNNLMTDATLLQNKGLYDQAQKVLKRARKLAEDYELHPAMLEIIRRQRGKTLETSHKELEASSKQYYDDIWDRMEVLENELRYQELSDRVFIAYRTREIHDQKERADALRKLMDNELLKDHSLALSLKARYWFHFIHSVHLSGAGDHSEAYPHYAKAVEVLESNPSFIEENSYRYKIALSNYLQVCHRLRRYHEFPAVLKKIRDIPAKSYDEAAEEFQNTYFLELLYLMNTCAFEEAVKLVPEIAEGLSRHHNKLNKARELAFYHNLTVLFFVMENYGTALDWLSRILNESKVDPRQDIQAFSRIFQLIIHYELDNIRILDNLFSAAYRTLGRQGLLTDYEEVVFLHLKKIPYILTRKERNERLQKFKDDLLAIRKKREPLGMEEILLWIESKLTGKKMAEILKEQLKSQPAPMAD